MQFDFVGFKMFPLNGDIQVSAGEIRNQDIAMQGRSEFVAENTNVYEEYEECTTPHQKRLVKNQVREGVRNVSVQILSASTNELLAEFSYSNDYTERTVLFEGECH